MSDTDPEPPRRRYRGYLADSARWDHVSLRPGDVVVSTPSKSGTTWTQTIVAMMLRGSTELDAPLSELSPWVDMLTRPVGELAALLDVQPGRRVVKTHTPLDGIPRFAGVTYLCVFRHPFDVVLSDRDHAANSRIDRVREIRLGAVGQDGLDVLPPRPDEPDEPAEHLRWFVDADVEPTGTGPNSLLDLCGQLTAAWERRDRPDVHLLRYEDLWADLPGQVRTVAGWLAVDLDDATLDAIVAATTLDAMRERASTVAPEAAKGFWHDDRAFFRQGGRRDWADLVTTADLDHLRARTVAMAGAAAAGWLLGPA